MEVNNISAGTSFGMALRKPSAEVMDRFVSSVGIDKGDFVSKLRKRGLQQVQRELKDCKKYDVAFKIDEDGKDVFQVIENAADRVIGEYRKGQGGLVQPSFISSGLKSDLDKFEEITDTKNLKFLAHCAKTAGKYVVESVKLFILNPKDALPKTLLTAARDAKALEKASADTAKARVAHNNAINDVNDIFNK